MKSLSYLNKYFFKYKYRLLLGVLFLTLSNYFAVEMPLVMSDAVDMFKDKMKIVDNEEVINNVAKSKREYNAIIVSIFASLKSTIAIALALAGIYILYSILKGFFLFLQRQTIIVTSRYIEYDLKNEVYAQYQKLGYHFYKKSNTGDLLNRISEDVGHVRMYLGPGVMYTINLVVLFIMIVAYMISINGFMTMVVLIPLPIMSIMIYLVSSRMNRQSKKVQEEQSKMTTLVQETFSGLRVVRAFSKEKEREKIFADQSTMYLKKNMNLVKTNVLFMPTIIFLIGLSNILVIYVGGQQVAAGKISLGNIVAFMAYVNMLTWPFASVGWVTSLTQRAAASQTRINEFLKEIPEIDTEVGEKHTVEGAIAFENVSLTFDNTKIEALKNISFEVKIGETLAIIGRTGSGKSAILSLLARAIDPTAGTIKIDEIDLKKMQLDNYRDQIGVVPQDVFLFSDSISNNLKFGTAQNELSDDELTSVTKKTHVFHNIDEFPSKFETILGERGVNVSGGQKQRITISRALLKQPKIMLLDDCLSAVDTETEDIILKNLDQEMKGKTSIIVSHRISTIRNATRILVIEEGQIVEQGTHAELMEKNGVYTEMYQAQLIEE
jgi:ATP-binding cassette, subfamily B, multidrug efflux pump